MRLLAVGILLGACYCALASIMGHALRGRQNRRKPEPRIPADMLRRLLK